MRPTNHRRTPTARFLAAALVAVIAAGAAPSAPDAPPHRTKAEVDKLIEEAGKTPPAWWNDTPLVAPPELDLTWKQYKPWNNKKDMAAYTWDVIDPNPARWHEGVKLVHHSLSATRDNPEAQQKIARNLAQMYAEMLQDYARGAYWAKKADDMPITLASCYAKLGCPEAAREILNDLGLDTTRNGQAIKLWAEIGDLDTALQWAADKADQGMPTTAWLAAADACRRAGKIDDALNYYNKVLVQTDKKAIDFQRNQKRARASIDAIRLFDKLDLSKIPDGIYKDNSLGYVGPVEMVVTVKNHRIESLAVGTHHEKQFYASFDDVPPQIIKKQSVKGIDTTTGATITSEAIINATAKALSKAQSP
jgi:uncharacterized protein with FMN-binding domain